jgi:hypothetical protein
LISLLRTWFFLPSVSVLPCDFGDLVTACLRDQEALTIDCELDSHRRIGWWIASELNFTVQASYFMPALFGWEREQGVDTA